MSTESQPEFEINLKKSQNDFEIPFEINLRSRTLTPLDFEITNFLTSFFKGHFPMTQLGKHFGLVVYSAAVRLSG